MESSNPACELEDVKMGEECDGFEKVQEIVSEVIAAHNVNMDPETINFNILLTHMTFVLEQIKQKILAHKNTLFRRDDRTPNPDEEPLDDCIIELAQGMAIAHYNSKFDSHLLLV